MFNRPLAPQCPILASRRPRHLHRGFTDSAPKHITIPVEVETPRPCLSTVNVCNTDMQWSEQTGIVTWKDQAGNEQSLSPGHPVVLYYDPDGRYMRYANGSERLIPTLVTPDKYKRENKDYVYCGLLYQEQAVPIYLKTQTLLVVIAGHHTVAFHPRRRDFPEPGDSAEWEPGNEMGDIGLWLTKNSIFMYPPGQVNKRNNP